MTKDLLLRLYARKDRKRRKMLFALFRDKIKLDISIDAVVEMINQELGKQEIVNAADIKYCRHYFGRSEGKKEEKKVIKEMHPQDNSNMQATGEKVLSGPPAPEKLDWTDVADISVAVQGIKSKFKKDETTKFYPSSKGRSR